MDFPNEIYLQILEHSDPKSAYHLMATNNTLWTTFNDNSQWFLLLKKISTLDEIYNPNFNYRNYYNYLLFVRDFYHECYNISANYGSKYSLLDVYVKTGVIKTMDVLTL